MTNMKRNASADGLSVSRLTVGCWSFGGDANSYWGAQEQSATDRLVREALDMGADCFDTAFGYNGGESERSLGAALKGVRERAVIVNKIPIQPLEALPEYENTVRDSLKRLGTDYVDVMMIHWPTKDEALLRKNLEALNGLREKGMARRVAVSNFGVRTLEIAREMGVPVALDEFAYNLMSRALERELAGYLVERGIGIAAYMPVMQGVLTGKYASIDEVPIMRRRTIQYDSAKNPHIRHGGAGAEAEVNALIARLRELARETGISPGALSIAWLLAKPAVATVIVGCRDVQQLRENAEAANLDLAPELVHALDEASAPILDKIGDNLDIWTLGEDSRVW